MRQSKQTEETVKIDCDFVTETEKAWLLRVTKIGVKSSVKEWFAKSQCEFHQDGLDEYVEMPQWLAEEKELV